jgi:hypothetical protein
LISNEFQKVAASTCNMVCNKAWTSQAFPPPIYRPRALPRIALEPRIRRAINPPVAVPIRDRVAGIVAGLHGVCSVLPIDAGPSIGAA